MKYFTPSGTQLKASVMVQGCMRIAGLSDREMDALIGADIDAGINYFDHAENAFVSAYRKYIDIEHFDIHIEYIASPRLDNKILIITDPMLATGGSMELAYKALLTKGEPSHIHIVSVLASQQAIEYLQKTLPDAKTTIWCGAIDPELNEHSYIVPGLGDAGDLCFGEKE